VWWYTGQNIDDDDGGDHLKSRVRFKEVPYKEPSHLFEPRVHSWKKWLANRPEKVIAVVGHYSTTKKTTGHGLNNCELMDTYFDSLTLTFDRIE
jgi:hypothetical protein